MSSLCFNRTVRFVDITLIEQLRLALVNYTIYSVIPVTSCVPDHHHL